MAARKHNAAAVVHGLRAWRLLLLPSIIGEASRSRPEALRFYTPGYPLAVHIRQPPNTCLCLCSHLRQEKAIMPRQAAPPIDSLEVPRLNWTMQLKASVGRHAARYFIDVQITVRSKGSGGKFVNS